MQSSVETVAFFGASGGVCQAALRRTLVAGKRCVALCRDPSKFMTHFPELNLDADTGTDADGRLTLVRGNAHDADAVARCLVVPTAAGDSNRRLVDVVVFSIGSKLLMAKRTTEDPNVCAKGMAALLEALQKLRTEGVSAGPGTTGPRIVAVSTTGISKAGRDVPIAFLPFYHGVLHVPHADKRVMEDALVSSGEMFSIVRPSLLVDSDGSVDEGFPSGSSSGNSGKDDDKDKKSEGKLDKKERKEKAKEEMKELKEKHKKEEVYQSIRVGIEDPVEGRRLSSAIGYTISRTDTGRWIAENLVLPDVLPAAYARRIATITY